MAWPLAGGLVRLVGWRYGRERVSNDDVVAAWHEPVKLCHKVDGVGDNEACVWREARREVVEVAGDDGLGGDVPGEFFDGDGLQSVVEQNGYHVSC